MYFSTGINDIWPDDSEYYMFNENISMPRVLRIINRLNLGGPTFNAAYLTKYLEPEFETLLVSGMKDETEESSEFIVKELGLEPVYLPDMYRELNPFKDYKSYYKLRKIIDEFKPDIVHTHAAKAGAVGRLAAAHSGTKTIIHTFHGHVFHSYFNPVKSRMFLGIERYLAKKTTKIIALSDLQKWELANTFSVAPDGKFTIIPLGFDLARFETNTKEKRKKFRVQYRIADEEIAIGIIGRLVPIKNHELFLKAIKEVSEKSTKKIRAFIIGDGEERGALEILSRELGLLAHESDKMDNSIVTFTSWIKEIDVSNAGMDIIALTSNNEGTPVSLIEAQASGVPVVSTDVGGVRNIIIDGGTGLLSPPRDLKTFSENLLKLIENNEVRHKMSVAGNENVRLRFSYQRLCSETAALYNELIK